MWKCTVCKKENQDTVLRCQCGFDRRLDYEHLRTFAKLDAQDIQKYQRMKTAAQEAIKPKVEATKPVVNQPKVEASKPVTNKPSGTTTPPPPAQSKATTTPPPAQSKATATTPPPQQSKATTTPPPPAQPKTSTTTTAKPVTPASQPKAPTTPPTTFKPAATPILLEKTIFPKTKLDWLVLVIGAVLLCKVVWPYHMESAHFFTSEYFFEPLSNFIRTQSWNTVIFVMTISYLLMYKSLGAIQYKKKRLWIFMYPIFSMMPLCFFGDVVWGLIMYLMGDTEAMWGLATTDNLMASWFFLQIVIVLLAFFEDPAKAVAKRKARNMSILPQTKLQTLVFVMGIVLAVIFANRENWYYTVVDIEDIMTWKTVVIFWILLYWLGKRLRYTYKFLKVVSYIFFSCLPLILLSDVIWSSDLLRPYAGENGAGCVLTFLAGWILVISMAIKEEQLI